jgi:16S rRNA U516 pseudouridylate synthase RsuA-like enzyme
MLRRLVIGVQLQRIAFGPLQLDKRLTTGNYRFLDESEVNSLKQQVGL